MALPLGWLQDEQKPIYDGLFWALFPLVATQQLAHYLMFEWLLKIEAARTKYLELNECVQGASQERSHEKHPNE